ncbi:fatty acyl-CoA reductase wat-like isoform X2 [Megachile rotundata]|uniref:fatty acyl-CoA reductase wat-like isoform X2 n=1 Tax=Megachile rotundata TaxID=143995 RepID=UPI003FD5D9A8
MINYHSSLVRTFYAGQSVLVTGGTGFLGKLLIEKLLRTCTEMKCVYALARSKEDESAEERFERIFEEAVFDRLKKEVPKFRQKVRIISGDCTLAGLGLSAADADLLTQEVSVVFNVAATVRFDENLKKAITVNVTGTKELMDLCKCMPALRVVIHVSTAYSNCIRNDIEEKFYPAPIPAEHAMELAANFTDQELNERTKSLLGAFPNTYVYTKCIAEQLVRRYGEDLPVGIFRPAIGKVVTFAALSSRTLSVSFFLRSVLSTYKEPTEGWVDNIYGPTGALAAAGIGLLRTMNMDKDRVTEMVPADYTVNALIVTAWAVATKHCRDNDPPIYNYHSSWGTAITWGQYMDLAVKHGRQAPSVRSVWCYNFTLAKSPYTYFLLTMLLHLLPATLVDAARIVVGRKPSFLKMYKKLHKFCAVTSYFGTRDWNFSYSNTENLWDSLCPEDQSLFAFSMNKFDWDDFMYKCVRGLRVHIFKDDPSTINHAKLRMARFTVLHNIIKYTAFLLVIWFSYRTVYILYRVTVANRIFLDTRSIV